MTLRRTLLLAAALSLSGSAAHAKGPGKADVDRALQQAAELLVESQESYVPDSPVGRLPGSKLKKWQSKEKKRLRELFEDAEAPAEWPYEGVYRVGPDGRIPPGYRVGGTAIVCEALVRTPGFEQEEDRKAAVARALEFMTTELEINEMLAKGPKRGYDVRGWGHTYALKFFLLARDRGILGELSERVETLIPDLIDRIAANQTRQGGWNYAGESSVSPFMTGSTLLALYEAKEQGFDVDAAMVESALKALEDGRTGIGSFAYSGKPRGEVKMPGSSARSAIAELVLFYAGRSDEQRLEQAVLGFFDGWKDLLDRKSKQGTHEGPYGIAPYYFYYGHTYAALAIESLPEARREKHRDKLRKMLWKTRDKNGGWNDRIFPRTQSYSTAMAALALLAPEIEAIPAYEAETKEVR